MTDLEKTFWKGPGCRLGQAACKKEKGFFPHPPVFLLSEKVLTLGKLWVLLPLVISLKKHTLGGPYKTTESRVGLGEHLVQLNSERQNRLAKGTQPTSNRLATSPEATCPLPTSPSLEQLLFLSRKLTARYTNGLTQTKPSILDLY